MGGARAKNEIENGNGNGNGNRTGNGILKVGWERVQGNECRWQRQRQQ